MTTGLFHFLSLRRAFQRRFFEHELLSSGGDVREPLADFMAILITFGIVLCYKLINEHSSVPYFAGRAVRGRMAWADQQLLVTISIAVAAVFVILCWETLFPDLTDCLVLSPLPVRMWTVFAAKLGAVLPVFGILVGCTNLFPILVYPALMSVYLSRPVWLSIVAYAVSFGAASIFVLSAAMALQGVLVNLLPYRIFQRASAYVQAVLLGCVLLLFFVTPNATLDDMADPYNRFASAVLPPFWFVGIYEAVMGNASPEVPRLAGIGIAAILIALATAGIAYSFGYARYVRRTIEGGSAVRQHRRAERRWIAALRRAAIPNIRERALFNFVWRTMTRSRTHRLMLGGYVGVGAAFLLVALATTVRHRGWAVLFRPDASTAAIPIVISFFVLLGMRVVFSLPVNLKANWIFRMLEAERPDADLVAVRKLMFAAGVLPAVIIAATVYPALWGMAAGLRFAAVVLLIGLVVLETLTLTFRKIPFTCSYLPGKANLKATLGLYVLAFVLASVLISLVASAAAVHMRAFVCVAGVCVSLLAALYLWRRRIQFDEGPLIYDETPDWKVLTLEIG